MIILLSMNQFSYNCKDAKSLFVFDNVSFCVYNHFEGKYDILR